MFLIFNFSYECILKDSHLEMRSSIFSITKFFLGLLGYTIFASELQETIDDVVINKISANQNYTQVSILSTKWSFLTMLH